MLNNKLTLLIHSCEKFSDLWPAHTTLLNKNWPNRNFATYILTDSKNSQRFDNIEIISAGDGKEITERIRYVLPLINTEYVLVTLDDYFLTQPISSEKISRLVDIMDKESYDYMRLFERPKCKLSKTPYKDVYTYDLNGDYRVNLYAGIWRKSFIEKTLGEECLNAWQFEVRLTERARDVNGKCAVSHGDEFPILDVVRKGRILQKANKYLKKYDLYRGDRPVMPQSAEIKLAIQTFFARLAKHLPNFMYNIMRKTFVKLGKHSYREEYIQFKNKKNLNQ